MIRRHPVGWVWLCLGLAGCSLFDDDIQPPCPPVITIADAQNMTAHRPGPGRDLTDILYNGSIVDVATICKYDDEGRVDATVRVALDLSIGPAVVDDSGEWNYFVTVTNPDRKIIAKQVFTIGLQFEQAVFRTLIEEAVTTYFDYAPWPNASGFTIYVGFQLTRDQLEYSRSLKR